MDHISDKTAVNDRRHSAASSTETNDVVVNMAFALSYADLYRTCIKLAQEKNIDTIPSYAWFLLQFWPTHRSASRLLHYTGRFRVRRIVQARILRKANPDAHYARTVYKFLKERAIKHRLNTVFFNGDAKCKISVGEPGFPLAAVARGKKVIIGSNQKFEVADHDFSKLLIIPDAVLVHYIPEVTEDIIHNSSSDEDERQLIEDSTCHKGEWYAGKVFYAFKSMVLEGSTALRGVVEMGNVLEMNYTAKGTPILERFYLITDGGGDRNVGHLSVKKALVGFFRKYDF